MSIFRIEKLGNFVMMDKGFLHDPKISWKVKGLLAYLLSLPDNWEISIKELSRHSPEGRDAVYAIIKKLIELGYIVREKSRDEINGKFKKPHYKVCEVPQISLEAEKEEDKEDKEDGDLNTRLQANPLDLSLKSPLPGFPDTGFPDTANPYGNNNKYNNININNTAATAKKEGTDVDSSNDALSQKNSAAAFSDFNSVEPKEKTHETELEQQAERFIVEKLSLKQKNSVSQVIIELSKEKLIDSPKKYFTAIENCLLDPSAFTKAENLFLKKLNTIKKLIRLGQWSVTDYLISAVKNNPEVERLKTAIADLRSEKNSQLAGFETCSDKTSVFAMCCKKTIQRCDQEIDRLMNELKKIQELNTKQVGA